MYKIRTTNQLYAHLHYMSSRNPKSAKTAKEEAINSYEMYISPLFNIKKVTFIRFCILYHDTEMCTKTACLEADRSSPGRIQSGISLNAEIFSTNIQLDFRVHSLLGGKEPNIT